MAHYDSYKGGLRGTEFLPVSSPPAGGEATTTCQPLPIRRRDIMLQPPPPAAGVSTVTEREGISEMTVSSMGNHAGGGPRRMRERSVQFPVDA